MLDILAGLLMVALAAFLLHTLLRLTLGPATSTTWKAVRWTLVSIMAIIGIAYWTFQLSKSRTWQFMGGFVPYVATADSVVALTFDDGPEPGATETVLAMLDQAGVKGTFFLTGAAMADHPEQTRMLVEAGHQIANHTYNHPWLLARSWKRMRQEVEETDALIRAAGYADEIHIRTPYGKRFVGFPIYLWRNDRTNIFFDVEPDSYPAIAKDDALVTAHVLENVKPGSIVLMHVMYPSRAEVLEAVPAIVEGLKAKGYRIVTVHELMQSATF